MLIVLVFFFVMLIFLSSWLILLIGWSSGTWMKRWQERRTELMLECRLIHRFFSQKIYHAFIVYVRISFGFAAKTVSKITMEKTIKGRMCFVVRPLNPTDDPQPTIQNACMLRNFVPILWTRNCTYCHPVKASTKARVFAKATKQFIYTASAHPGQIFSFSGK